MLKSALERAAKLSHWKRLGKVKLGLKVKSNRLICDQTKQHQHVDACYMHFPKDVKYFVVPEQFKEKLGAEPMKLNIVLAFPTLEQNFDIQAASYKGNGAKFCSTKDGITAERLVVEMVPDPKNPAAKIEKGSYKSIPCPADDCEFRKAGKCPPKGGLEFMVPELYPAVGTLYMKVGSRVGYEQMLATLLGLERFTEKRENGMLGVHMILERELVVFNIDIKGVRTRVEKYIPKLSINFEKLSQGDRALLGPSVGQNFQVPELATDADVGKDDDEDEPKGRIIDQDQNQA